MKYLTDEKLDWLEHIVKTSGAINTVVVIPIIDELREQLADNSTLRAKLAEAERVSIKNIPFYRLAIVSLQESVTRLLMAYDHSPECPRNHPDHKTDFLPDCTCAHCDDVDYGTQTLYNTEQVVKALATLQDKP